MEKPKILESNLQMTEKDEKELNIFILIKYCQEMEYISKDVADQMAEFRSATGINPFGQPEFIIQLAYGLKQRKHDPKDISVKPINQELLKTLFDRLNESKEESE